MVLNIVKSVVKLILLPGESIIKYNNAHKVGLLVGQLLHSGKPNKGEPSRDGTV